ncbi:MAG: DUF4340 domain-containing protein [Myxococcales bacterium]|nr:DUF4340 domain-containing protein [Myxococcales bacterium]
MKEVRLYLVLLAALMVAAYLSWTHEDKAETETKVTLLDTPVESIEGLRFYTKTSTVVLSFRTEGEDRFPWFELKNSKKGRAFAGSDKVDELLKDFAPFEALRSLGKDLGKEELALTGLDEPERKLVVVLKGKEKVFEVGKRTAGARDHYVRAQGAPEVYLVASRILADLEFPEGKFMQRKLRDAEKTEVAKVAITAGPDTKVALQQNRLSTKDAFWATEDKPEDKDEALGNFIEKLEKLTATEYADDPRDFEAAVPVLEATWYSEGNETLGRVALRRKGEGKTATYFAKSPDSHLPVQVSRFTAEQLERDAASVLKD